MEASGDAHVVRGGLIAKASPIGSLHFQRRDKFLTENAAGT